MTPNRPAFIDQHDLEQFWENFYTKCQKNRGEHFFGTSYLEGLDAVMSYLAKNEKKEEFSLQELSKREVKGVMKLCKVKPWAKLLNLPCGKGRHDLYFLEQGLKVYGWDINLVALQEAKKNLDERNKKVLNLKEEKADFEPPLHYEQMDMRQIPYHDFFDIAVNLMYSIGYFFEEEENFEVLKQYAQALKPGGTLLIQTSVPLDLAAQQSYDEEQRTQLKDGKRLLIQKQFDPQKKRMNGIWSWFSKQGTLEQQSYYSTRIYAEQELIQELQKAWFASVVCLGDREGNPRKPGDPNLILLAKKS